jgi:predicted RNase H-like nuclease (RuvC/YqgF family)
MSVLTTILSNIPWGQVVESAPKIAQGAGRLWENVKNRGAEPAAPMSTGTTEPTTDLQLLQSRTLALESQVQALHDEMRSSALLVKELADQNEQLVERMQTLQQRQRRLVWLGGLAVVLLAAAMATLWLR